MHTQFDEHIHSKLNYTMGEVDLKYNHCFFVNWKLYIKNVEGEKIASCYIFFHFQFDLSSLLFPP